MTDADELERLRHGTAVYRTAIEAPGHRQLRSVHRAVAADAEWTLALATGAPLPASSTSNRNATVRAAIAAIYYELAVICQDIHGGRGGFPARREAAQLLGLPLDDFQRWCRT